MDLRRSDLDGLTRLAELWKATPGAEFEAALKGMDLTSWQDVIQYLRSLGMRENPQIVKMNICLSNDIRITLEGAGVIQAYCRDNRLTGKPFVAMLKENIADATPVELGSYSARAKLKREIPLAADDERVKEVLARWDSLGKHFRNIQRFEFVAPGGIPVRFDISIVRENAGRPARTFQEARVTSTPPRYEAEVELTASRDDTEPSRAAGHIIRGLSWLLQGRQRSYVLVSNAAADNVRDSVSRIFGFPTGEGGNRNRNRNRSGPAPFRYPGPQPATLERRHIAKDVEPGTPNLRKQPGGYNVTDKADGLRCLLYVSDTGRIFLVDGGGRVYATGKQTEPSQAGLVLDGELIRRDRKGATVSHFYAFDILANKGGKTDVTGLPFMVTGAMFGSAAAANTRQAAMASAVSVLSAAAQSVKGVPPAHELQVGMKTFRTAMGDGIFTDCVASVLSDAASAPYNTDGLIFTPNASPLPLARGTWMEQLKWKPPHENTIDFLVIVDRERGKDGMPTAVEAIGTKYREDSGQTVRYKTLRLFVGSNRDVAFADPRRTVLNEEPLPTTLDEGEWHEVEFRPTDPRDPMAAVCYVGISEGILDPAGATAAASTLDTDSDVIRCTRTGDIIQSDMIVEMAYHPERAPGWRWEPVRVRHDKTERWLAQQAGVGRKGGTMNADWVANSIWNSIHNPITEKSIITGIVEQCAAPVALVAPISYSVRRAPARDLMKVQCLRNFHNDFVKRQILLRKTLTPGATLCDLAMGRGDDIGRWIAAPAGFVFGCDVIAAHLNDPEDGAYRRLLNKMVAMGGRDRVPRMVFAQADAARHLQTGEAGLTPEDQSLLQQVFAMGGPGATGFDVVSCMFAIHYMFRDENTLAGFLTNLADTVKVGGYFIGCGFDGDAVARMMAASDGNSVVGRDGRSESWVMTKRYGAGIGASVPPSAAGLGLAVDVDFISLGETHTEYLVSWPYLQAKLAEVGLELLTAEETAALGLPASSQMFGDTWSIADATGETYAMTEAIRRYSFLNRWWIFKRRSERRPAPPLDVPAPPALLTEVIPLTETGIGAPEEGGAPAPAVVAAAAGAGTEAPSAQDLIELEDAAEAAEAVSVSKEYLINPATKKPDLRLGPELANWPRYMALGTPVEIADAADASIKYPSVEAAIAAAKYQRATNKPELGAQLFRVEGAVHQKFEKDREKLIATGAPEEALEKTYDDQLSMTRIVSGAAKMKAYKAEWNKAAWDAQKEEVYQTYLKQRYEVDERFREMVNAIKAKDGQILFVNGTDPTELGVGVRIDGSIAGGENKIGKWMMALSGGI
jgi:hypothetical protein